MAKQACSSLVLLPVGPGSSLPFLLDTLESVARYALPDHKVLLADDSAEGLGDRAQEFLPEVDVLVLRGMGRDTRRSVSGKFFETIAKCVHHATDNYDFRLLLRLDTDALMCNAGADERGIEFLEKNPKVGMIGSYRTRCDDQPRDFTGSGDILKSEAGFQVLPAQRAMAASLNELLQPALANGYEYGENVIAPGSMLSREAAEKLCVHPLFGDPTFRSTRLGDDHLNSLILRALGFELADFATGDQPLAIWLRNIEWSPEEIVKKGKAIVHSVRGYQDQNEDQVRAKFKSMRL